MKSKKPIIFGGAIFIVIIIIIVVLAFSSSSKKDYYMSISIYKNGEETYSSVNTDSKGNDLVGEDLLVKYVCENPLNCGHAYDGDGIWYIIDGDKLLFFNLVSNNDSFTEMLGTTVKDIIFNYDKSLGNQKVRLVFFEHNNQKYYGAFGENVNFDYRNFYVSKITDEEETFSFNMTPKKLQNGVSDYDAYISFSNKSLENNFVISVVQYKINNKNKTYTTISYLDNQKYEEIDKVSGYITIKEENNYFIVSDLDNGCILSKGINIKTLLTYEGESYIESEKVYFIKDNKLNVFDGVNEKYYSFDGTPLKIYGKYIVYLNDEGNISLYDFKAKKTTMTSDYKVSNIDDLSGSYDEGINQLILYNEDKSLIFNFTKNTITVFDSID